jgi:hypothetical protein
MSPSEVTDYERFKLAVADALARWQAVEIYLQEFFVTAISSPDGRWSAAAYNAVKAFGAKLDMLHEILLYRLPSPELVKEWKKLRDKLSKHSRRRNKLVHWTFLGTFTETNKETYTYVSMPFGDARIGETGKQLTEADLDEMALDFGILQHELRTFRQRVVPQLVSPEKPSPDLP